MVRKLGRILREHNAYSEDLEKELREYARFHYQKGVLSERKIRQSLEISPESFVGRAFRGTDGIIRWITHFSTRKYFTVLWLHEKSGTWHSGGIVKAHQWEGGEEVPAPQKGDVYKIAGATGLISERTA